MARSLNPRRNMSRLRQFAKNHLGVIMGDELNAGYVVRSDELDMYDKYYDSEQYADLMPWEEAIKAGKEQYVPVRQRQPRIIYAAPKMVVDKVVSKLLGSATFPTFKVEGEDDDTDFFKTVIKAAKLRSKLLLPMKRMCASGAVFVRFYLVNGAVQVEHTLAKYCYPKFDPSGELNEIIIKYVYEDSDDRDQNNTPKKKWYQLQLTQTEDIMFDNPEYREGSKPTFNEVDRATHGLGWVQGEWFVNGKDKFNYDGESIFKDCFGFFDELNYSLSQSSQATSYAQEPQLITNEMDEDELDVLVRSSEKAWNLGKNGKAAFLEAKMEGVTSATELRSDNIQRAFEVIRVCIVDPEKAAGNAQSGEALKQLYAPLIELVDELRTTIEPSMVNLIIKIGMTCLHYNALGEETMLEAPKGYVPSNFDLVAQWPPIFPVTIQDISNMANACNVFQQAGVVSRETLTRWVASATTLIDDADEELKKIETQEPLPSPFGTFGDEGGSGGGK